MMILSCYMFVFHQVNQKFKKLKSAILMGTALIRQLSLDFDVWSRFKAWGVWTHVELLDDLLSGFMEPLFLTDLWLLLQVRGIGRTHLSLHFGVFRQFQLFKTLKLWDP